MTYLTKEDRGQKMLLWLFYFRLIFTPLPPVKLHRRFLFPPLRFFTKARRPSLVSAEHCSRIRGQLRWGVLWRKRLVFLLFHDFCFLLKSLVLYDHELFVRDTTIKKSEDFFFSSSWNHSERSHYYLKGQCVTDYLVIVRGIRCDHHYYSLPHVGLI